MPEPVKIAFQITSQRVYKCFNFRKGYIQFKAKVSKAGLNIALYSLRDNNLAYIIKVGHQPWTHSSVILEKFGVSENVSVVKTPHILSDTEWKGFWIYIQNKTITFGREKESEPILIWKDESFIPVGKVGFKVHPFLPINYADLPSDAESEEDSETGVADIVIDSPRNSHDGTFIPRPTGVRWIRCSLGHIPYNALIGGHQHGSNLYVVRAMIQNALTPGKIRPGKGYCEVGWGSREKTVERYEVLADFDGVWVRSSEDKIPPNALLAGRTEDNHPLYVGRVGYRGSVTIGKVQPNHKVLYITYGGQELAFENYEILCHRHAAPSAMPNPINEEKQLELKWVYSCNGRAPRNAFVVGDLKGCAVILIRAKCLGIWFPGWMQCGESLGHIVGADYNETVQEYEALCNFKGHWEKFDSRIPRNAVPFGKDHNGSIINVGRALHLGNMLCGPIDRRIMKCKIPFENDVTLKDCFEVLCYPNRVESFTKRRLRDVRNRDT